MAGTVDIAEHGPADFQTDRIGAVVCQVDGPGKITTGVIIIVPLDCIWNAFGFLDNDIRHMVKFGGNYFLPLGFNLGITFAWYSGQPYTMEADARNAIDGLYYSYNIDSQGSSGRYPATWRLDFRV